MLIATLVTAIFLCSLSAGFVFGFATVVMPGLRPLDDGGFLRAFQLIDGVIQNNQPLFIAMWAGSVAALLAAIVFGVGPLTGVDQMLLLGAGVTYLGGVQIPTAAINIPLNNRVQALDIDALDAAQLQSERAAFESRWNRWNAIRTGFACLAVIGLLVLLTRL